MASDVFTRDSSIVLSFYMVDKCNEKYFHEKSLMRDANKLKVLVHFKGILSCEILCKLFIILITITLIFLHLYTIRELPSDTSFHGNVVPVILNINIPIAIACYWQICEVKTKKISDCTDAFFLLVTLVPIASLLN